MGANIGTYCLSKFSADKATIITTIRTTIRTTVYTSYKSAL